MSEILHFPPDRQLLVKLNKLDFEYDTLLKSNPQAQKEPELVALKNKITELMSDDNSDNVIIISSTIQAIQERLNFYKDKLKLKN